MSWNNLSIWSIIIVLLIYNISDYFGAFSTTENVINKQIDNPEIKCECKNELYQSQLNGLINILSDHELRMKGTEKIDVQQEKRIEGLEFHRCECKSKHGCESCKKLKKDKKQ